MSEKWDRYFLRLALEVSSISHDPNTRVGALLVGPDREIRGSGFNGFPRGIADTAKRLADRDMKLRLTVHAERNALLAAARVGIPLKGCRLYIAACEANDATNVFGGNPCTHCSIEVIQAGIVEVVSYPMKGFTKWREDLDFAKTILLEAGVRVRTVVP